MPTRPQGRCTKPGCTAKAIRDGRCAQHPRIWEQPSQHTTQINRTQWEHARQAALTRDQHTCQACGAKATEVDHIWEIADGGALYDLNNLQSLCFDCHKAKTLTMRRQRKHQAGR